MGERPRVLDYVSEVFSPALVDYPTWSCNGWP